MTHWKRFITKSNKSLKTSLGTTFGSHPLKNSEDSPSNYSIVHRRKQVSFPSSLFIPVPLEEQMTTVLSPFLDMSKIEFSSPVLFLKNSVLFHFTFGMMPSHSSFDCAHSCMNFSQALAQVQIHLSHCFHLIQEVKRREAD